MNPELDIFGVFVPSMLVYAMAAYFVVAVLSRALRVIGLYRCVWHPPLFNLCIYVCLLGASVMIFSKAN
ncbi:DUF1656 domain-containing protein [Hyphomicrobium sp.]|uniref:DUF1656 domain-containing protein n=1 Tax=Hyphomicrobium sp. TaxID=82 RepID=UPI002D78ACC2|nr:DUF1656 domain-containing protein [Hyphomicrobium sp.]HET6390429.1 DUF1656 domain-containing protein [Hyphomicrobium sp.]